MNDVQHRKFRKCEKVQTISLTFSLKQDIHAHQTSPYKKKKKKTSEIDTIVAALSKNNIHKHQVTLSTDSLKIKNKNK